MMSLYKLCLYYVGNNVGLLDSLVGFPDSIGQEIFLEAASQSKFKSFRFQTQSQSIGSRSRSRPRSEDKNPLKIFFEAYGFCGILESLDLRGSHLFVNDALEENMWLVQGLIQLDLSSCGLGDQHTILPVLTSLPRLKVLSLSENGLTNEGVRKFTARLRIFSEKSSSLSKLDLSGNPDITIRALLFLKSLAALVVLNVSGTAINNSAWQKQSDSILPFNEHLMCDCVKSAFHIQTQGWASDIVIAWKGEYSTQQEEVELTTHSKACHEVITHSVWSFYSKKRRQQIQAVPLEEEKLSAKYNPLVFVTSRFHCQHVRKPTWNSCAVEPAVDEQMSLAQKTSKRASVEKMVRESKVRNLQNNRKYSYPQSGTSFINQQEHRQNLSSEFQPPAKKRCEHKGQDMSREIIPKGDNVTVRKESDDSLLSLYSASQRSQRSRKGSVLQLLEKLS